MYIHTSAHKFTSTYTHIYIHTHIHMYTHQGQDLRVDVEGSMMTNIDGKSKRTYLLVVRRADGDGREVPRRYSDFIKLHKQLKARLPRVKLPEISQLHANTVSGM